MNPGDMVVLQGQPTEEEWLAVWFALQVLQQTNESPNPAEPSSRWGLAAKLPHPVSPWLKSTSSAWQASGRNTPAWPA